MKEFKIKPPETPLKDSLDPEVQEYIEARFPQTNDDTLQEDYAFRFITDSDFIDTLKEDGNLEEKTSEEIRNELWKLYNNQIKLGSYLDVHKSLDKNVKTLIEQLEILQIRTDIKERFKLQKSGISEVELETFRKGKVEEIKAELSKIKNEEISSENVTEIFDKYAQVVKKYAHLYHMFSTNDTTLN